VILKNQGVTAHLAGKVTNKQSPVLLLYTSCNVYLQEKCP